MPSSVCRRLLTITLGWTLIAAALAGCSEDSLVVAGVQVDASALSAADAGQVGVAPVQIVIEAGPASGARVTVEATAGEANHRVHLRYYLESFADLLGIAGHLRFDPAALRVVALEAKPVPAGASEDAEFWQPFSIARESPAGRLLLGGARFRHKPHPYAPFEGAVVGRELWLDLELEVVQPGTHVVAFDPASLVARTAAAKDIAVHWPTVRIVQTGAPRGGQ